MSEKQSKIGIVTRTRSKWKQTGKQRTVEENSTALGYITWQIALNGARKLHLEEFRFDDDGQRIRVIEEYMAFLIHLADRSTFGRLQEDERTEFVSGVARAAARHLQRNKEEIVGPGNHAAEFLELTNRRSTEYASCSWQREPGYAMRRALGAHVQDVMGSDQTNKWVIDQVMDIDAPEMHRRLTDSLDNLLVSS